MSTKRLVILVLGLSAVLLVLAQRPTKPTPELGQGETHPSVGQAMESFQLEPLVGDTAAVTLESLRGEVVLINFWGTWCPPCMSEFPHLVKMSERLKHDKRFRFVPVACGPSGEDVPAEELRADTEAYLKTLKANLDVYSDPGSGVTFTLVRSARLDRFGYPTSVLLDREGTIRALWQGYQPGMEAEIEAAIGDLLKS